jgi:Ca-activated chloride channel family protein
MDVAERLRPVSREGLDVISARRLRTHQLGPSSLYPFFALFASVFVFFPFLLAKCSATTSQEESKKITASANLVVLPVSVTDAHGTFIQGLKQEDFRVFEDGQLQRLQVFEEQDAPVTVGLIVDHSRSMGSKLRDVVAAVATFTKSSNPQDEMFVVDFNDDVTVEIMKGKAFSNDPKELSEALTAVSARGRTALYDAVSEGLQHLHYAHRDKKALIIISDGGDNASHIKYSQVREQARQSQALIYSIALVGYDQDEENPGVLRKLCKDTGGIAYFPEKGESVTEVAKQIARDLREQYTLGYVPQSLNRAGKFRKVEVKLATSAHGKARIRTRPGYELATEVQSTDASAAGSK